MSTTSTAAHTTVPAAKSSDFTLVHDTYEKFAENYATGAVLLTQPHATDLLRVAAPKIRQAKRILELGCGSGVFGEAYIQYFPNGIAGQTIVCTDLSPAMVKIAQKRITAAAAKAASDKFQTEFIFQAADATDLQGFDDQSFDMVVSVFGIFLVPDQVAMMKEVNRVLKRESGALAATSWTSTKYNDELKSMGYGSNFHDIFFAMKRQAVVDPKDATADSTKDSATSPSQKEATESPNKIPTPLDWFDRDKIRANLIEHVAARDVTIRNSIHTATFDNVEHVWSTITTTSPHGAMLADQEPERVAETKDALFRFVAHNGQAEDPVFAFLASNLVLATM